MKMSSSDKINGNKQYKERQYGVRFCKGCGKPTNFMASLCRDCKSDVEDVYLELMQ